MNLDDFKVYIFVRQDLPIEQQLVQATHAAFQAGKLFGSIYLDQPGIPFHVLVGMPNPKALTRVLTKIQQHQLPHYVMTDTDIDAMNPSAIAVLPVFGNDAEVLRNYRLWRYSGHPVAAVPQGASNTGENFDVRPGANAVLAQTP